MEKKRYELMRIYQEYMKSAKPLDYAAYLTEDGLLIEREKLEDSNRREDQV